MRPMRPMRPMRSRAVHRTSSVVLAVLASSALVLALAACTVSTVPPISATATATAIPATPTATRATLTCAYTFVPFPPLLEQPATAPFVGEEIEVLCLVTGAPSSDTSFTLRVVITSQTHLPPAPPAPPCLGTLQQGTGACARTYLLVVGPPPLRSTGSTSTMRQPFTVVVSGVLLPSHRPLGPVIAILATSSSQTSTVVALHCGGRGPC